MSKETPVLDLKLLKNIADKGDIDKLRSLVDRLIDATKQEKPKLLCAAICW